MDINHFGAKLKQYRVDHSFTQDSLARILGTSKQVLSRYENGQRIPKISVVYEYSSRLAVDPSYFLDDSASPSPLTPLTETEEGLIRDYRTLGVQGRDYIAQQMVIAKNVTNLSLWKLQHDPPTP